METTMCCRASTCACNEPDSTGVEVLVSAFSISIYLAGGLLVLVAEAALGLSPAASRIGSTAELCRLYSITSLARAEARAFLALILLTWSWSARISRVLLTYRQQKTTESTALMARTASRKVVNGLFFIISGGDFTDFSAALSNSFFALISLKTDGRTNARTLK